MRIIKTILTVAAADILCLFVGFTLAGSSAPLIRAVSAVCTVGILFCILGSFAHKTAREDQRLRRAENARISPFVPFAMGIAASLPSMVSWLILRFSPWDFYRWHKLINGWFIQIFNMIEPDASSAALSEGEMLLMLPLVFVPFIITVMGYFIGKKRDQS